MSHWFIYRLNVCLFWWISLNSYIPNVSVIQNRFKVGDPRLRFGKKDKVNFIWLQANLLDHLIEKWSAFVILFFSLLLYFDNYSFVVFTGRCVRWNVDICRQGSMFVTRETTQGQISRITQPKPIKVWPYRNTVSFICDGDNVIHCIIPNKLFVFSDTFNKHEVCWKTKVSVNVSQLNDR